MKEISNDGVVMFDCDDTLCMWGKFHAKKHPNAVKIVDETDGTAVFLNPHKRHIDLLRKFKSRGYSIVVWSGNGMKWAKSVVKAFGLEKDVDLVMSKPMKYVDDLKCEEWMGNRIYLEDYK